MKITLYFILCQKIQTNWSVSIPIISAVVVFILNLLYQNHIKRKAITQNLANELIHVCDKMLRYATDFEVSCLYLRFYEELIRINPKNNTSRGEQLLIHHVKQCFDLGQAYNMNKSELKKTVKDFNNYWENDLDKRLILSIMKKAVLIEQRVFEKEFLNKFNEGDEEKLQKHRESIQKEIEAHVLLEGVGIHLVKIQKIIDPNTPALYGDEALEKTLKEKLKNYVY